MDATARRLRAMGGGLGVLTILAWGLALAWPSRTTVVVTITRQGAIGRVNGAELPLEIPPAGRPPAGLVGWYLAAPRSSLYYQPVDPAAPLAALGRLSAASQDARPAAAWEFPAGGPDGSGAWPAAWTRLPADPSGDQTTIAAGSPIAAGQTITGTLVAGRVPAGLLVDLDAAGTGYAFIIRPERRTMAWWRVQAGHPTEQLAGNLYRPALPASLADLIQEAALALTATLALALLTLALTAILALLPRPSHLTRNPGPIPVPPHVARSQFKIQHSTRTMAAAAAFALAGLGAAAAIGLGPLDGIPHVQDDVAYLWQAKIFALGRAWVPAPPLPEFFAQGFILITEGRWFVKYPPGWPLLLVPGVWAGVPWLVNPLCAGLSLALVYLTGRRLYGPLAGAWAALLGLTSPFVLFMSGSYMSHPATLLGGALALYCFVRLKTTYQVSDIWYQEDQNSKLDIILALLVGFGLGWAFISREATAVGIAAPFLLWGLVDCVGALVDWARDPRLLPEQAASPPPDRRRGGRLLRRLAPYAWMILGAGPPLLILGTVNQAVLGSPFRLAQELVGSYDRLGFGPGFGPEPAGHTPALGLYNALVYGRTLAGVLFGWPPVLAGAPLLLALAGIGGRPWRHARWDLFLLGGAAGLVAIYFAWWSATTIFGPRYWYEALPFLLLLSGRGIDLLGRGAAAGWRQLRGAGAGRAPGGLAAGLLVGGLVLFNLGAVLPGQVHAYTGYNDVDAASLRRVAAARLDHALVFVALQPAYPNRDFGKVFFANDPLLRGPVVYARDLGPDRNRALLHAFPDRTAYYLPLEGPPHPGWGP